MCVYNCTDANKPTTELLNDLFKEISPNCNWYRLGTSLLNEALAHRLATIEKNNPNDAEKCSAEVLKYCFDSCAGITTWSDMIDALKKIQDTPVPKIDDSIKGVLMCMTALY